MKKVNPGDLAGGLSNLEMTWLLYCAGAATAYKILRIIQLKTIVRTFAIISNDN